MSSTLHPPSRSVPFAYTDSNRSLVGFDYDMQNKPSTTTALLDKDTQHPIIKMSSNEETANGNPSPNLESQTSDGLVSDCLRMLQANRMLVAILAGVVLGVGLGFALREAGLSEDALTWIGLPGEIFLRCLNATIVPLVITMVITSTATLDGRKNGRMAMVGTAMFLLTHLCGALIAISMFFVFKPDEVPGPENSQSDHATELTTQDVFADLIRNIFPDNLVSAAFEQAVTQYVSESQLMRVKNETDPLNYTIVPSIVTRKQLSTGGGTNILGLIAVCTAVGMAVNKALAQESVFLVFFQQTQKVIFVIIKWIFWLTPIGVLSLITKSLARVDDMTEVFHRLGLLIGAVLSGLAVHQLVAWSVALFVATRRNPFSLISRCTRPFLIGFCSTSTAVALPDMMTSCDRCGVTAGVSRFLLPMSVNLQADGSAVYIASCVLFLAQSAGGVTIGDIVVTGAMTTVMGCAIPPVPSSSIVTIIIIMTSLNLPIHDVALLFAAEWLLDRVRSGVNAVSHVLTCIITDKLVTSEDHSHPDDSGEKQAEDITSEM